MHDNLIFDGEKPGKIVGSHLRSEQFVQDYFIRTSLTFIILLLWCKLLTRKLYEIGVTTYTHCEPLFGK